MGRDENPGLSFFSTVTVFVTIALPRSHTAAELRGAERASSASENPSHVHDGGADDLRTLANNFQPSCPPNFDWLHGNCDEAFAFYETVFGTKRLMTMKYSDAPAGVPCPEGSEDLVLHTAIPLGNITLMGADAPPGRGKAFGGFDISLEDSNEGDVKRLFAALSEGGVMMPLAATFWSPLFGMCSDKFGVSWMISVPGPQA